MPRYFLLEGQAEMIETWNNPEPAPEPKKKPEPKLLKKKPKGQKKK